MSYNEFQRTNFIFVRRIDILLPIYLRAGWEGGRGGVQSWLELQLGWLGTCLRGKQSTVRAASAAIFPPPTEPAFSLQRYREDGGVQEDQVQVSVLRGEGAGEGGAGAPWDQDRTGAHHPGEHPASILPQVVLHQLQRGGHPRLLRPAGPQPHEGATVRPLNVIYIIVDILISSVSV